MAYNKHNANLWVCTFPLILGIYESLIRQIHIQFRTTKFLPFHLSAFYELNSMISIPHAELQGIHAEKRIFTVHCDKSLLSFQESTMPPPYL